MSENFYEDEDQVEDPHKKKEERYAKLNPKHLDKCEMVCAKHGNQVHRWIWDHWECEECLREIGRFFTTKEE